jgi:hypothetical protein
MAISASARKALGARSVSIQVTASNGAAQTISNAQLQASAASGTEASAVEKAQKAIYSGFLNKTYDTLADLIADVGVQGVTASVIGANVASSAVSWNLDATPGKAVLNFTSAAGADFSVRISLASSIAS